MLTDHARGPRCDCPRQITNMGAHSADCQLANAQRYVQVDRGIPVFNRATGRMEFVQREAQP